MVHTVQPREWRRFGFGGPPEPWAHDAHQDLDRLATSYYLEVLEARRELLAGDPEPDLEARIEELFMTATRHKHEIDYTLRHWATPVERARVTDRLGSLMRISRRLKTLTTSPSGDDFLPDAA
ncbi:MAG TPA: hypothetical protein VHU77_04505 [Candidatus Limnocylindria bacterium]|nr:hypothetical protein [Candidatus Limnocylindria bacterium]